MRRWAPAAILCAALVTSARAQVDCDTPDDLCTGDPCIVGAVEVNDSCVLDFGARTLVIDGSLRMPNGGELSLTAGTIQVDGRIQNMTTTVPGAGPRITLAASGDVVVDGPIRVVGVRNNLVPGEITVQAGGNLTVRSALSALTSPTTISWSAGSGDVDFSGRVNTGKPGGEISIAAGGRIDSFGTFRKLDRIDMSSGGDLRLGGRVSAEDALTADAGGMLTLETVLRNYGSDVVLRGALGLSVLKTITMSPAFDPSGSATLESSAGDVLVALPVRANDVFITAGGDVTIDALVAASPPTRAGGTVLVESTGGVINTFAPITAQAGDGAAPGDGAGGNVRLTAPGAVAVHASILVNAFPQSNDAPGGTVEIEGASVLAAGVTFDADGKVPGPDFPGAPPAGFRFTATAGDVTLDGVFHARGGPSVIQATASGDVDVAGDYRVAPNGCIGLSAGGTLATGGATFDTAPVATCP
jgi:filamentous hemagglutinin